MSSSTFYAVSVVDAPFSGLCIYIKVLQTIIEVFRAGTKIAAEESGMGGENGCYVDASLLRQG